VDVRVVVVVVVVTHRDCAVTATMTRGVEWRRITHTHDDDDDEGKQHTIRKGCLVLDVRVRCTMYCRCICYTDCTWERDDTGDTMGDGADARTAGSVLATEIGASISWMAMPTSRSIVAHNGVRGSVAKGSSI